VRNDEILIGRFRGDDGAKEVVVVFAIQQGGEVVVRSSRRTVKGKLAGAVLPETGAGTVRMRLGDW